MDQVRKVGESLSELQRARSLWEKAVGANYKCHRIWIGYAEFEERCKCINNARNVWRRAVELLPGYDQLWHRYANLEEKTVGDVLATRDVYEMWMSKQGILHGLYPKETHPWLSYIKFEIRQGEVEKARQLYKRCIEAYPQLIMVVRYALFEADSGNRGLARALFEAGGEHLENFEYTSEHLAFASFEVKDGFVERARMVYRDGVSRLPSPTKLNDDYTKFREQYGERSPEKGGVAVRRERERFLVAVEDKPRDYDLWAEYAEFKRETGNTGKVRGVFGKIVNLVPAAEEDEQWRKYTGLLLKYVEFEEYGALDYLRARELFRTYRLKLRPMLESRPYLVQQIWIQAAKFEIRHKKINEARKILDFASRTAPNDEIFVEYIAIERIQNEIPKRRNLYTRYLEYNPLRGSIWSEFAEMEAKAGEDNRVKFIYEHALGLQLDMPPLEFCEVALKLCKLYGLSGLNTLCDEKLSREEIEHENVKSFLELAVDNGLEILKEKCIEFLIQPLNHMMMLYGEDELSEFLEMNHGVRDEIEARFRASSGFKELLEDARKRKRSLSPD